MDKIIINTTSTWFNGNLYHEGNIFSLPDFDVFFSLLDIRKRNIGSLGRLKNGNLKLKTRHVLTLSD